MNKQEVIAEYAKLVSELGIKTNKVILGAGGALVLMGLRDSTADLDVAVPEVVFDKHAITKKVTVGSHFTKKCEFNDKVDLHIHDDSIETTVIDGVWVYTPVELYMQKIFLSQAEGRSAIKKAQDVIDADKLEIYMDEHRI